MGSINIAVCDNEIEQANMLASTIGKIDKDCEITVYTDMKSLTTELYDNPKRYEVVFMDMEWGNDKADGVDYANELGKISHDIRIVSVSAYTMEYIEKLFFKKMNICGVLNKPVDTQALSAVLNRIKNEIKKQDNVVLIRDGNNIIKEREKDIIFVQCIERNVYVHKMDGKLYVQSSFKEVCSKLSDNFYIINKGICVNMAFVKRIENYEAVLDCRNVTTGPDRGRIVHLPIGVKKRKAFREKLFAYLKEE